MPELPEVNTLMAALNHNLRGDSIIKWGKRSPKLRQPVPDVAASRILLKRPIVEVKRIAKSIYFDFALEEYLLVHLGMTGSFVLADQPPQITRHEHLRLQMKSGRFLSFFDPRRFGVIAIAKLPVSPVCEPFSDDLTPDYLQKACARSSRCIKALIMDQSIIAGLGNIYASEALLEAKILPFREAASLNGLDISRLCDSIIKVTAQAVKSGLKSLKPDFAVNAATTHFPIVTRVYGREGQKCLKCRKAMIMKVMISGRSSCYCPVCQL